MVYTFDLHQHILNFSTFQAKIGVAKYDLLKFLGSRPVQIMAVAWDPVSTLSDDEEYEDETKRKLRIPPENWPYLYNLEVLHERSTTLNSVAKSKTSDFGGGIGKSILSLFGGGKKSSFLSRNSVTKS